MLVDLKLDIYIWQDQRHPLKVIEDLGITYQHAIPSSIGEIWTLWNCENVPDELPKLPSPANPNGRLTRENFDPMKFIGHGMTEEMAKEILDRRKELIIELPGS